MPLPETDSSDEASFDRLRPQALLARGLADSDASSQPAVPDPGRGGIGQEPSLSVVADLLAQLFPEYRIEGRLGNGGGGTVYQAEHRQLKRRVALKILSGALPRSTAAVARFEREIEAVGQLDDPRMVRAFDGGQRDGVWFLAMELVEGVDFGALSRAVGQLVPADACELIRQAALALQHAHERNLIHRDVKPSNLMLAGLPDGSALVKVLDFGLVQLTRGESVGGDLTISGELLGTVDYVAPEQIVNPRTVDRRADVYGLGATLFRLLSGQTPHHTTGSTTSLYAKLMRISHESCPSIGAVRTDLPAELVAVVDRLVAREPADRFASAAEVAEALAPFAVGHRISDLLSRVPRIAPPVVDQVLSSRRVRRRKTIKAWAMAAGTLAVVLVLWAWLLPRPSGNQGVGTTMVDSPAALATSRGLAHPRGITLGADGALYGGTIFGGQFNQGALYRFAAPTSVVAMVHFTGTNGLFKGRMPGRQLLLARNGVFYGVTERGGSHDRGTLFRFDPRLDADLRLSTLWEFQGSDGSEPLAGLIEDHVVDGVFYGGTQLGGSGNSGTLFRLVDTNDSPRLETLVHLTGDSGAAPGRRLVSALVQTFDGTLFGTTPEGGAANGGTAFRVTTDGRFTSLVTFGQPPSRLFNPTGGLVLGRDGQIYGHCRVERDGAGAAFRLTAAGELQIIAQFGRPNGSEPASTLLCASDGNLYGTTLLGGTHERGTVFKLTPEGKLSTLASFPDVGGQVSSEPWALPTLGPDGNLYGTIEIGGSQRGGLLYRVTPTGELTVLVDFLR